MERWNQIKNRVFHAWVAEIVLILVMIVLTFFMLESVENIQGSARVVNYTGIVRGATQRLVKLEQNGQPNDELITQLNTILDGLEHGGGTYDLIQLDSEEYRERLEKVIRYWDFLKQEIFSARKNGAEDTRLLPMSETYFFLANDLVESAEEFSQKHATQIRWLEFFMLLDMGVILFLLIKQTVKAIRLGHRNSELNKTAYIDIHTGLPNKSSCEKILSRREVITVPTSCIMFDLNDLKRVNDNLGHIAGDTLILNFAHILRRVIPERHFLGRYGGDEFVAVITDMDKEEIEQLIEKIRAEINAFNELSRQLPISFACGYAFSSDYQECTIEVLLGKADYNMYHNKQEMKTGEQKQKGSDRNTKGNKEESIAENL